MEYYQCSSNKSRLSGEPLRKCIKVCRGKICSVYEKELDGETNIYIEDNRNFFQKHIVKVLTGLASLFIGSYLIPKFIL